MFLFIKLSIYQAVNNTFIRIRTPYTSTTTSSNQQQQLTIAECKDIQNQSNKNNSDCINSDTHLVATHQRGHLNHWQGLNPATCTIRQTVTTKNLREAGGKTHEFTSTINGKAVVLTVGTKSGGEVYAFVYEDHRRRFDEYDDEYRDYRPPSRAPTPPPPRKLNVIFCAKFGSESLRIAPLEWMKYDRYRVSDRRMADMNGKSGWHKMTTIEALESSNVYSISFELIESDDPLLGCADLECSNIGSPLNAEQRGAKAYKRKLDKGQIKIFYASNALDRKSISEEEKSEDFNALEQPPAKKRKLNSEQIVPLDDDVPHISYDKEALIEASKFFACQFGDPTKDEIVLRYPKDIILGFLWFIETGKVKNETDPFHSLRLAHYLMVPDFCNLNLKRLLHQINNGGFADVIEYVIWLFDMCKPDQETWFGGAEVIGFLCDWIDRNEKHLSKSEIWNQYFEGNKKCINNWLQLSRRPNARQISGTWLY